MTTRLVLIVGVVLGVLGAPALSLAADQATINASIAKAIERLWEDQREDGSWAYGETEARALGMTALAALALFENGVEPSDPRFQKAMDYVRAESDANTDTYSVSLATVLLARVGYREDRAAVRKLATRIVSAQQMTGGWGYTVPKLSAQQVADSAQRPAEGTGLGDISVTQFAVLALWQSQRAGARVEDSLRRVRQRLAWAQTANGGWGYKGLPDLADSNTMTTAGTFIWVVSSAWEVVEAERKGQQVVQPPAEPKKRKETNKEKSRRELREQGATQKEATEKLKAVTDAKPTDLYDALVRGAVEYKDSLNTAATAAEPAVKEGTDPGQLDYEYPTKLPTAIDISKPSPLLNDEVFQKAVQRVGQFADSTIGGANIYYLWSLERLGVLLGREVFGKTKWFDQGSDVLIKRQNPDGSFGVTKEDSEKSKSHYLYGPDTAFAILFLRKANLGSEVTRMLNPASKTPFIADGKQNAGFATLEEAVKAAKSGGVVEIQSDGPFSTAGILIDKPLTIRAGNGYSPILQYGVPKDKFGFNIDIKQNPNAKLMIVVEGQPVVFEGLRFRMDPPPDVANSAMIRTRGGELRFLNCSLSETNQRSTVAIDIVDCPRILLRNTSFIGFDPMIRVGASGRTNLLVRDCVAFGNRFLQAGGDAAAQVRLLLIESTINTDAGFDLAKLTGGFLVLAENNAFKTGKLISDYGPGERSWDGQLNLYDVRQWIAKSGGRADGIEDLEAWKRLFQTKETRSRQTTAPFAVYRQQIGGFRHEISPQDWAIDSDQLVNTMPLRSTEQLGANVYMVGAGVGYLQFSDRRGYENWFKDVTPPSQRNTQSGG